MSNELDNDSMSDGMYGANPPKGYENSSTRRATAKKVEADKVKKKIKALQEEINRLKKPPEGCEFCAGLPRGAENLKHDCGQMFGLTIKDDVVVCPQCGRIMAAWE
jgi:hypothetical protein